MTLDLSYSMNTQRKVKNTPASVTHLIKNCGHKFVSTFSERNTLPIIPECACHLHLFNIDLSLLNGDVFETSSTIHLSTANSLPVCVIWAMWITVFPFSNRLYSPKHLVIFASFESLVGTFLQVVRSKVCLQDWCYSLVIRLSPGEELDWYL